MLELLGFLVCGLGAMACAGVAGVVWCRMGHGPEKGGGANTPTPIPWDGDPLLVPGEWVTRGTTLVGNGARGR